MRGGSFPRHSIALLRTLRCVLCASFASLFALSFGASPLVLRLCQSFKIVRRGFP